MHDGACVDVVVVVVAHINIRSSKASLRQACSRYFAWEKH